MNNHTAGPWEITKHGTPDYAPQFGIYADGGNDFAIVKGDNAHADAVVMAAGPDLLAALRILADHAAEAYPHFESERGQRDIAQALEAIAKATPT